MFLFNLVIDAL